MKNISVLTAFAFSLLLLAIIAGCDPDKKPSTRSSFFEAVEKPLEQATFQAENGLVFYSQGGNTKATIPASSLVDANGNTVTGTVNLEFREIYTKGDMMLYNRPTQTVDGRPLESGGEVFLSLTQNSKALKIAGNRQILLFMRTENPLEFMDVFYGSLDAQNDIFGWLPDATPDTPNVVITVDSFNFQDYGYQFFSDNLDWINCDRFFDIPANQKTTVCAKLPTGFSGENTTVYLVYTNRNSVMHLWNPGSDNTLCGSDVPLGDAVRFVSVSVQGDEGEEVYFLAHQTAVVTAGLEVELVPVKTSLPDIEAYLGSF